MPASDGGLDMDGFARWGLVFLGGLVAVSGGGFGLADVGLAEVEPVCTLSGLGLVPPDFDAAMRDNCNTVNEAMAVLAAGHDSELGRALALEAIASRWEARVLGVTPTPPLPGVPHATPSQALLTLALRHGAEVTQEDMEAVLDLDLLPSALREALTRFVDAFIALEDAIPAPSPFPFGPAIGAREAFLATIPPLADAIKATAPEDRDVPLIDLAPAVAIDVAGVDRHYAADFALQFDAGGADSYRNNAGGSNVSCAGCLQSEYGFVAAAVDLSGDDTYGDGRWFGANGGSLVGFGLLVDASGNDLYTGGAGGINGGGGYGLGALIDAGGHDVYRAEWYYVNGGGEGGGGMLIDHGGDDSYEATHSESNGGGGFDRGAGFLLDTMGNDRYVAGNDGVNGGAHLDGRGFLLDVAGNDVYLAGGGGANGGGPLMNGVDPGVGFLFDAAGLDSYTDADIPNGTGADSTVWPKNRGAQIDARTLF